MGVTKTLKKGIQEANEKLAALSDQALKLADKAAAETTLAEKLGQDFTKACTILKNVAIKGKTLSGFEAFKEIKGARNADLDALPPITLKAFKSLLQVESRLVDQWTAAAEWKSNHGFMVERIENGISLVESAKKALESYLTKIKPEAKEDRASKKINPQQYKEMKANFAAVFKTLPDQF